MSLNVHISKQICETACQRVLFPDFFFLCQSDAFLYNITYHTCTFRLLLG
jgi:hypothetical protein